MNCSKDLISEPRNCAIIHFMDDRNCPKQLIANSPSETHIITTTQRFQAIKPHLQESIRSGDLWIIATTYEWGVSQLGLPIASPTAIFIKPTYFTFQSPTPSPHPLHNHDVEWLSEWDFESFASAIQTAKTAIHEGNIYQINLSYPSILTHSPSIETLYHDMMSHHSPSYGAYIHANPWAIASCSPEEFFYFKNGHIRSRPIKGTIGRHANPVDDQAAYQHLQSSAKDAAELTMITDLIRNDLSMISAPSSVETTRLCDIVSYQYVHHLVSTIESVVSPGLTPLDCLMTLAPGGSITGCPKYSAVQHIQSIEAHPRRFYTGHIGFIHGTQEAAFNVAIRTCYQYENGPIVTHSGCGITIDSDPVIEFQESKDKLNFLKASIHVR